MLSSGASRALPRRTAPKALALISSFLTIAYGAPRQMRGRRSATIACADARARDLCCTKPETARKGLRARHRTSSRGSLQVLVCKTSASRQHDSYIVILPFFRMPYVLPP